MRGDDLTRVFGGGAADQLPARGKLGSDLKSLSMQAVEARHRLCRRPGWSANDAVSSAAESDRRHVQLGPFDRIVVATGQRPDLDMTRELRLDLDPWLESRKALGPTIDPNLHSCGSVPPHGYRELSHPEPGYFAVGVKSYGRAPTFLMATGYEQVRSVAAYLAGDLAAANAVQLVLPETGVCSTNFAGYRRSKAIRLLRWPCARRSDACCVDDTKAKAAGAPGCGRGPQSNLPQRPPWPETCWLMNYNVLFLCTGNSARSIIAEAILNKVGDGNFAPVAPGVIPKGQVNPASWFC